MNIKKDPKPTAKEQANNTLGIDGLSTHPNAPNKRTNTELPIEFGRYRLLKVLGEGGMGAVYLAHDTDLDRKVALKLPHFVGGKSKDHGERFRREARLAATLSHPNICRIFDIGEQDGRLFLTMEYIEGKTLNDVIKAKGAIEPRTAVNLVKRIASAVQVAHAQGIIHRDLKPANIMIKKDRDFVIMDFGLARRVEQEEVQLTATGAVLGTPAYMAPEQLRGENNAVGPQSDVYSLGIILYELLTGQRPFQGTLPQIYAQVLSADSVSPRSLKANVDPDLDAICQRATSSDQNQRYRTAEDFAKALNDYLTGQTQRQSNALDSLPSLADIQVPMASFPAAAIKKPSMLMSKLPLIAIGSGVGVIVLIALAAFLFRGLTSSQAEKNNDALAGATAPGANPINPPVAAQKADDLKSTPKLSSSGTPPQRDDLTALQGAWDVVEEEYYGVEIKSEDITRQAKTILVDGNQFDIARTFPDKMRRMFKGSIALNPNSTGGQFDWKGTMPGDIEGEILGQYELRGDMLKIVYSFRSGNETVSRPSVFASKGPGAGTVYSVCRRKEIQTTITQLRQFEKDIESLQGQWQCVTFAAGGRQWSDQQTKEHDKKLVISGDRFQMTYNLPVDKSKRGIEEGPINRIESNTNPTQILMIWDTLKPEPQLFKGIFELNGDRLRHCYRKCGVDAQDCPYPASFATEKGQAMFDVVYVRVPTK